MRITLLCALAIAVVLPQTAQAQELRIYTDASRFEARTEARATCQPLVVLFYDSALVRFSGGEWIDPQGHIEEFFEKRGWTRRRDAALAKAVVVLLRIEEWSDAAADLGVIGREGWASVSPFELSQITSAGSFGKTTFR